jgi:hypothetical protein
MTAGFEYPVLLVNMLYSWLDFSSRTSSPGAALARQNQSCKFLQCGGMEKTMLRQRPFAKIVI